MPTAPPPGPGLALQIDGMTCAACAARLERVVGRLPGVDGVHVDFVSGALHLRGAVAPSAVQAAVEAAGFTAAAPALSAEEGQATADAAQRAALVRLAVAAVVGMQAMSLGIIAAEAEAPAAVQRTLGLVAGLIATPGALWAGAPLLRGLWAGARSGGLGVDGLVGAGLLLSLAASWAAVARGQPEVWFDTAAMLVTLHLAGRLIEGRVRQRAADAVRALLQLAPPTARREGPDGQLEEVPVGHLRVGDRVWVRAGERLPVDGIIEQGHAGLDRALLTGEATPERVGPGAVVEAGALSVDGALAIRAAAVEGHRRVDHIVEAVRQSLAHRPALVRGADRVAAALLPVLAALTVGVGAWGLLRGEGVDVALMRAAAVVVVTCPCALTLAAPLALGAAAAAGAERGVVFRDGDALDRIATADALWLDKTGTLTSTILRVRQVESPAPLARADLALAAQLGAATSHPIARAVAALSPGVTPAAGARTVPGDGVELHRGGALWRLGRPGWASARPADPRPAVDLGRDGVLLARFFVDDPVVPDAGALAAGAAARGLSVQILSGDRPERVAEVAATLGVSRADGGMDPEGKARAVAAAAQAGARVILVGDGLNDVPAMSAAWASAAPAGATDAAAAAAGVLLLQPGVQPVLDAIDLARRTRSVIRQNLAWALLYNLAAVPLAVAGLTTPLLALAAMTASSLTVTANAARLLRRGDRPAPRSA